MSYGRAEERGRQTKINTDPKTVAGFDDEWQRFDQSELSVDELRTTIDEYFRVFPWSR
jgi:hypothetical protein